MVVVAGPVAPPRAEVVARSCATLGGLGAALVAGRAVGIHLPPCPFRTITGVPCPGCGITRLAVGLAHGRLAWGFGADPAAVVLLGAIAVLAGTYLVSRALDRPVPGWVGSAPVIALLVGLAAAHWATTLVFGLP